MTTATADTARGASDSSVNAAKRAGLPGRLCAAMALVSVGAHVWMAWEHRAMPWESALMLLMAAFCLPCAVAVWHRGHERAIRVLFVMALLMVAVHTVLLLGSGAMAGADHSGMGSHSMGSMSSVNSAALQAAGAAPLQSAMLGVIALELGVAMLAAWSMRRSQACRAVR